MGTHQQSAGVVVQPDVKSREIEIVAYNTSAPIKGSNVSHAERQVIAYLESQDEAWLARVESVDVIVIGRDICAECDKYIQDFKRTLAEIRKRHNLAEAKFNWVRGD